MMTIGMMHDKVIANLSSLINTFVTFFLFLMFLFFSCLCVVSQTSPTKLNVRMKWHAQCSGLIHHSLCLHEATPTHMTHPFTVTDRLVTLHQCKPSSPSLSCQQFRLPQSPLCNYGLIYLLVRFLDLPSNPRRKWAKKGL